MSYLQAVSTGDESANTMLLQQMLIFKLKQETFGLDIAPIKEIIEFGKITPIPTAPDYMRGVINIRGVVVPVLDLSARFGWETSDVTKRSCIVIVEVEQQGEVLDIGLLIDSVSEVVEVPSNEIKASPALGANIDSRFIAGMAKINDEFVIILSPNHILSTGQLEQFANVSDQAASGSSH